MIAIRTAAMARKQNSKLLIDCTAKYAGESPARHGLKKKGE